MNVINRIKKLKSILKKREIDCAIIYESRNIYYFTDTAQHCILLIPIDNEPTLFVRRDFERTKEESPIKDIRKLNKSSEVYDQIKNYSNSNSIGLEMDTLRARTYQDIMKIFPSSTLEDISNEILLLRSIKDKDELDNMRKSAKIAEKVQDVSREFIKPGISELDLAAEIQREITRYGSVFSYFNHYWSRNPFIIASGEGLWKRSDFPPVLSGLGNHKAVPYGPSGRIIKEGEIVVVDVATVINGYTADHSRTFFVGKPSDTFKERYNALYNARLKAVECFKEGIPISDVFNAVKINLPKDLQKFLQGYDEFKEGMGHGIGLTLDELPYITHNTKRSLLEGNVIAFEPKIIIPEWGAINFEDDFIIKKDGFEQITNSPFYEF
ncbi:MAG: aminopeptidase P family protein [Candidatus Lokiarchaeota archaeon]|nr:aminopeptidase P family protein [Candidatus Lokiarchaeota archaeon]